MLKIAITGNIASGKSAVENFLKERGFKVLDTDKVAHNLIINEDVKEKIVSEFRDHDILENQNICRKKLGRIIFKDEKLRKRLENILHPLIKAEIKKFFIDNKNEKITFVSVPLLFEAKFENIFDKIVLVYASDSVRLDRLIKMRKMSLEHAQNRIKIQQNQEGKLALVDYVIYNDFDLKDLSKKVDSLLKKII